MDNYLSYIKIDEAIRFGKPCIAGTRITVQDILQWMGSGMSIPEIIEDFPELNEDKIHAALLFSANRESILKVITA